MRRTLLCALAAISLCALFLPASSAGAADVAAKKPGFTPTISWHECASAGLRARGAECGDVTVPLDYAKPDGKTITVAMSRIKHTVPDDEYQGIMLVNPGGPGGSGLTLSVLGEYVPKGAGKAYDWIGFDPRGVGSSKPAVSCDDTYAGAGYDRPRFVPTDKKDENAWMKITHDYTARCAANNGSILKHVTTVEAAKDMDSIRQALGEKTLNYYGFSYGTYLGQVYASLFPSHLRRAVFDGTVDPRGVWYDSNLSQDAPFDKNINIWFGWLAEHDDVYHLGDTQAKVHDLFYDTEEKLYADPVQADGGKLGGSEWSDAFLYAGYYQSTWTGLADVFSAFVNDGDVAALESAYLDASGYGSDNGYAMYLGVECTDTKWPHSWKTWSWDNWAIHAVAPYETWANAWFNEPCRHWPAPSQKAQKIDGKKTDSLLMIVETLDAATPYKGSLYVRSIFPHASLIAVPGGTTHANSLNGNACVDDAIADYLLTGARPARQAGDGPDVECEALPQPEPSVTMLQRQAASGSVRLDMQKAAVRP
ncbi:alpha/beta fold hydrolase [Aeromicrobium terrae]|uniref:Alpha/beta hydrolase n=1 Tax=Aeromicrobium terrae TaxID=2498846 RepID=A0A5C8NPN0_9ACTN|nr:alpha/beta fold hydrolase [Aeromicrobium terrae]TXL63262.1 alpha/beta hydrolase [Aeromicrobium terrae]